MVSSFADMLSQKSPLCALSLYCATTVYVYIAKQNPINGLTSIDVANLEMIIQTMEAIGRTHSITRAFLQQAYLDIERNGLNSSIRLPVLNKYRDIFGGASSNIPLLARSQVSRHTEPSPVLRRLPLEKPNGFVRNQSLRSSFPKSPLHQKLQGCDGVMRELLTQDCFQPVLGAVTRNVAPPTQPEDLSHKRKRTCPNTGLDTAVDLDELMTPYFSVPGGNSFGFEQNNLVKPTFIGGGMWRTGGIEAQHRKLYGHVDLPDRTSSSSSSSPGNPGAGTETLSGSSHTTPIFGLGNTVEENRIDLRAFQDRISAPIWQSTEETFLAQFTGTMVNNALPGDGSDPWGIITSDLDWTGVASAQSK